MRFLGVHFSNPAPFIPGVELIPHPGSADWATDKAGRIVDQIGKSLSAMSPGSSLNRLQYALFTEAARIVSEGVTDAAGVDTIVRSTFGFRLPFFGPFAIADMAGLVSTASATASCTTPMANASRRPRRSRTWLLTDTTARSQAAASSPRAGKQPRSLSSTATSPTPEWRSCCRSWVQGPLALPPT